MKQDEKLLTISCVNCRESSPSQYGKVRPCKSHRYEIPSHQLDEIVVGYKEEAPKFWLHLEQMDNKSWYLGLGPNVRLWIYQQKNGKYKITDREE